MRILALFFHPAVYGKTYIGGVERRFIEVSKVMLGMNISVYALEFYPSLKRFLGTGYSSHEINRPFPTHFYEKFFSVFHALRLAITIHRKTKFQIIAVTGHRYITFTIICAFLLAKLLRVPWVIISGGLLPRERTSLGSLISERRRRGFSFIGALTHTGVDWFTRLLVGKAPIFIAVSQSEKRDVIRFLGLNPKKIHVVGNGVNLKLIDSIPEREKHFDAAFLGRVVPGKGVDILINSWGKVVETIPSAQLVVIGGGRLTHYRRLIEQKNLSNNVKFVGFTPFEQAMTLLKQSKIFIFPSKRESFPLSVLEAMACNLPCIVSDIQPLREICEKGVFFIEPDNSEAFAETALDLLNHDRRREAVGLRARENAEKYGWENVVKREIRILQKALTQPRK